MSQWLHFMLHLHSLWKVMLPATLHSEPLLVNTQCYTNFVILSQQHWSAPLYYAAQINMMPSCCTLSWGNRWEIRWNQEKTTKWMIWVFFSFSHWLWGSNLNTEVPPLLYYLHVCGLSCVSIRCLAACK